MAADRWGMPAIVTVLHMLCVLESLAIQENCKVMEEKENLATECTENTENALFLGLCVLCALCGYSLRVV